MDACAGGGVLEMHMHVYACVHAHVYCNCWSAYGSQSRISGVFLYCSTLYILRQGLSLKGKLAISDNLAVSELSGRASLYLTPSTGVKGMQTHSVVFSVGSGNSNLGLHACRESVLSH